MTRSPDDHSVAQNNRLLYAAWFIIALGVLARLITYARYRVLWLDESYTATSILNHSFAGLFQPLDQFQIVPPFYLSLVKCCTLIFGEHEYALRFPSLLAGCAFLILAYALLRRISNPLETLLSITLLASAGMYLYYSAECKPYMLDTLIFIGLILLALDYEQSPHPTLKQSIAFACAGAIAVWTSFPSAFVLAGIGLVQGIHILATQNWKRIRSLILPYFIWAGAFIVLYIILIRPGLTADTTHHGQDLNTVMKQSWKFGFLPFPPQSLGEVQLYKNQLLRIFYTPLGFRMNGLAIFVSLIGAWSLWTRNKIAFGLLTTPLLLTFAASLIKLYPFDGRMILFLTPALYIFIGLGIAFLIQNLRKGGWAVGAILILLLIAPPTARMAKKTVIAEPRQEIDLAFEYVHENWQGGDLLYLTYYDSLVYRVAKYWYPMPNGATVIQEDVAWEYQEAPKALEQNLRTIGPAYKRLWLPLGFHLDANAFLAEIPQTFTQTQAGQWDGIHLYQYTMDRKTDSTTPPDAL